MRHKSVQSGNVKETSDRAHKPLEGKTLEGIHYYS